MPRSPLTETIQRVNSMVHYVQENLSADEYMLFLDLCIPEPEPEAKPVKKKRKPRTGKSSRGSGMAKAIGDSLRQKRSVASPNNPVDPDYYDPSQQCQRE